MNKHPGKIALKVKTERTVSPPVGTVMLKAPSSATKRKNREDDDEASVCRKTPRTDTARPENDEVFIRSTVNHDLRSDDKDVLKHALASLVDILYEEDAKKRLAKQTAFFQVCGHSAVVTIMTKHAECNVLQELGIVVLTNATRDNQAIKAAVENSIQCNGIGALLNLSDHLTSGKEFIKDLYGLPFILDIMKTFNTDEDLILWACKMIKKLARSEELRKPLVDSNVISSLAAALDAHKAHAGIQRDVREAFKYLLFMSDSLAGSDS